MSPRGTLSPGPPPTPAASAPPPCSARCLAGLRQRCEWSGQGSWLLLLPRRQPLLFELWEAGGSQAAGVRSSRQRPHPGVLRNRPSVRSPLPTRPPTHSLTHPPTQSRDRSPGAGAPPPPCRDPGLPPASGASFHVYPRAGIFTLAPLRVWVPSAPRAAGAPGSRRPLGQVRCGRVQRRASARPKEPRGIRG